MSDNNRFSDNSLETMEELQLLSTVLGCKAAREVLKKYPLSILFNVDRRSLLALPNIGPSRAETILALPRLLERMGHKFNYGRSVSCSREVFDIYRHSFGLAKRERFMVLTLNTRNRIIAEDVAAIGTVNTVHVSPAEILRQAILNSAANIICIHNHPSGDPAPSAEDRSLTDRIARAASLMGIRLLDHLIITRDSYYSFSDSADL